MESNKKMFSKGPAGVFARASFKIILLCSGMLLFIDAAKAQVLSDIKSLIEQIGALETYKDLCVKGYKIVEGGVQAYKTIKGAEFDLHTTFFSSLRTVSPQVAGYLKQSGALGLVEGTVVDLTQLSRAASASRVLSPGDRQYVTGVIGSLEGDCQKDVDMINMILSNGQTSMSDGERIGRLKPIIKTIQDQHRTAEAFIDKADVLMMTRANAQDEVETIESFY